MNKNQIAKKTFDYLKKIELDLELSFEYSVRTLEKDIKEMEDEGILKKEERGSEKEHKMKINPEINIIDDCIYIREKILGILKPFNWSEIVNEEISNMVLIDEKNLENEVEDIFSIIIKKVMDEGKEVPDIDTLKGYIRASLKEKIKEGGSAGVGLKSP